MPLLTCGGPFRNQVLMTFPRAPGDPTHLRALNERTLLYYTDGFWYLGWTDARFDLTQIEFGLVPIGEEQKRRSRTRIPAACIDVMRLVLRNRLLTREEHQTAMSYLKRPERSAARLAIHEPPFRNEDAQKTQLPCYVFSESAAGQGCQISTVTACRLRIFSFPPAGAQTWASPDSAFWLTLQRMGTFFTSDNRKGLTG
jgi:hypothetical protein